MNDLLRFERAFDGLSPYRGTPPRGFYADWIGAMTDSRFRAYLGLRPDEIGGAEVETRLPSIKDGEGWFEAVNQVEAVREASGRFVMVTLGACYGAQAVGCYLALLKLNPMPCKLVAVEPVPSNLEWIAQHFRNNGIDPAAHWLIGSALGDSNEPILFPVGAPGSGMQNAIATNQRSSREVYVRALTISRKRARKAIENLLLNSDTGIRRDLLSGSDRDSEADRRGNPALRWRQAKRRLVEFLRNETKPDVQSLVDPSYFLTEVKLLSAMTLHDVLGPFDRVDYLEADIQQSEIVVFPPFLDDLKRKVRRVHVGTHGGSVHEELARLFRRDGWEILFDFAPNSVHETALGRFEANDGILTVLNPQLAPASEATPHRFTERPLAEPYDLSSFPA